MKISLKKTRKWLHEAVQVNMVNWIIRRKVEAKSKLGVLDLFFLANFCQHFFSKVSHFIEFVRRIQAKGIDDMPICTHKHMLPSAAFADIVECEVFWIFV